MLINKDYRSYYAGNLKLLKDLEDSNSILYEHLKDVIYVLNYIADFYDKNNENEKNEDLAIIFETGFTYFHEQLEQIKIYYETFLNKDFSLLRKYEIIINFNLYIEDFMEALNEKEYLTESRKDTLNALSKEIEQIISNQIEWVDDDLEHFNIVLESCVPDQVDLLTTESIFAQIAEEIEIIR